MAKPRKLWSQLADSTKKRYKRNGVTPQQYNAGKITPDVRAKIYGKAPTSWATRHSEKQGLKTILKRAGIDRAYSRLPKDERDRIAELYSTGLIKGRGHPFKPEGGFEKLNLPYSHETVFAEPGKKTITERLWNPKTKRMEEVTTEIDVENYFRRGDRGQRIDIPGYGHPIRTEASFLAEQDFINAIEDQLGTVLDEADLWNDERRSALEASSP